MKNRTASEGLLVAPESASKEVESDAPDLSDDELETSQRDRNMDALLRAFKRHLEKGSATVN